VLVVAASRSCDGAWIAANPEHLHVATVPSSGLRHSDLVSIAPKLDIRGEDKLQLPLQTPRMADTMLATIGAGLVS
jgi:hypothetical protein